MADVMINELSEKTSLADTDVLMVKGSSTQKVKMSTVKTYVNTSSQLSTIDAIADNDVIEVYDTSSSAKKKISASNFKEYITGGIKTFTISTNTASTVSVGGTSETAISFSTAGFTASPVVQVSLVSNAPNSFDISIKAGSISKTGCTIVVKNNTSGAYTCYFQVIAIGV